MFTWLTTKSIQILKAIIECCWSSAGSLWSSSIWIHVYNFIIHWSSSSYILRHCGASCQFDPPPILATIVCLDLETVILIIQSYDLLGKILTEFYCCLKIILTISAKFHKSEQEFFALINIYVLDYWYLYIRLLIFLY